MHTGTMTFLFDSGQIFQESWLFNAVAPTDAFSKLRQVAQARRALLGTSARIALLKVRGQPLERVNWRGTGGGRVMPRDTVVIRHDGMAVKKQLRGVPAEVFGVNGMTPQGHRAFQDFNRVLNQCGCVLALGGGRHEVIRNLVPTHESLVSWKRGKQATKKEIVALLGGEEGERFWAALKELNARRRGSVLTSAAPQPHGG